MKRTPCCRPAACSSCSPRTSCAGICRACASSKPSRPRRCAAAWTSWYPSPTATSTTSPRLTRPSPGATRSGRTSAARRRANGSTASSIPRWPTAACCSGAARNTACAAICTGATTSLAACPIPLRPPVPATGPASAPASPAATRSSSIRVSAARGRACVWRPSAWARRRPVCCAHLRKRTRRRTTRSSRRCSPRLTRTTTTPTG